MVRDSACPYKVSRAPDKGMLTQPRFCMIGFIATLSNDSTVRSILVFDDQTNSYTNIMRRPWSFSWHILHPPNLLCYITLLLCLRTIPRPVAESRTNPRASPTNFFLSNFPSRSPKKHKKSSQKPRPITSLGPRRSSPKNKAINHQRPLTLSLNCPTHCP